MNNDVMVAPETAYIVGAFFQNWELPRADFALTVHVQDIPQNEAPEHIKEASTTQVQRFPRHMTTRPPSCSEGATDGRVGTSEYERSELYDMFKIWRKDRETDLIEIRSEEQLSS